MGGCVFSRFFYFYRVDFVFYRQCSAFFLKGTRKNEVHFLCYFLACSFSGFWLPISCFGLFPLVATLFSGFFLRLRFYIFAYSFCYLFSGIFVSLFYPLLPFLFSSRHSLLPPLSVLASLYQPFMTSFLALSIQHFSHSSVLSPLVGSIQCHPSR